MIKTSEETVTAPQISEAPKKRSRMPIIAGILAILIIATVVVGTGSYMLSLVGQEPSGTPSNTQTEYRTYSKYGLSFQYPKDMSLSEVGMLENTATSSSGMVLGELGDDYVMMVGWLTTVQDPNLEVSLNAGFDNMEAESSLTVDRGELATSTKNGDEMIYQYFDATFEGETLHGVFGVWYNDTSDRFYELMLMYNGQDVLPKFQQCLDSFVG